MHHFFVEPSDIVAGKVHISGENYRHLKTVLRAEIGEHILISDGSGTDYECEVAEIGEQEVLLRVCFREEIHELPAELYLFQGLPKSDKLELIVQKAVELGAYKIVPLKTQNTVVKLDEKKAKGKQSRWQGIAEAAAKQSKRSLIPEVLVPMSWKDAMDYVSDFSIKCIPYENAKGMSETLEILRKASELGKQGDLRSQKEELVELKSLEGEKTDYPKDEESKKESGAKNSGGIVTAKPKLAIFIGPEGGFSPEEIEDALAHGVQPISLGKRILRTETAAISTLSLFMTALELSEEKN